MLSWNYNAAGFSAKNPEGKGMYRINLNRDTRLWVAKLYELNRTIRIGEFATLVEAKGACAHNVQSRWVQDLNAGAIG